MVFWRTCGTYGQLLDCLRSDGFVPLHYSLMWAITRFVRPTPFVLRFVPALSGTLMVPAVYFLARQMLTSGTALLAAAFTACSAFMLFYSRDAKMYMDAWLFVALNTACLLWWFRSGRTSAWLCWIATGCAGCGLQISSAIPIGVSVLLLLTQSKVRWQGALLWVLGIVVILSGPVGYYEKFNRWKERVDDDWRESGLQWIGAYNYGRTGPQLARCLATTTLMGWEWPKDADVPLIEPDRVEWPAMGAEMLLGIFVLACLPWPRRWHAWPALSCSPGNRAQVQSAECRVQIEEGKMSEPSNSLRSALCTLHPARVPAPQPQWRVALWLCFLIVVPVYGFYCRSMPDFATPLGEWHAILDAHPSLLLPMTHRWLWIILALIPIVPAAIAIRFAPLRPAMLRGFALILVFAAVLALCQVIAVIAAHAAAAAEAAGKPWESLWVPRYIGFIWPSLAVAVAAMIMRLPTWPVRTLAIALLLGMNLGIAGFRIFGQTEPPVDRMAADAVYAEDPAHHTLAWMHLRPGMQSPGSGNLFSGPGEYYMDLLRNKPVTPIEFKKSIAAGKREIPFFPTPWFMKFPADQQRVIIWNQSEIKPPYTTRDQPPPPGWQLVSDEAFTARDCWIWQDLFRYRRMEYRRWQSK